MTTLLITLVSLALLYILYLIWDELHPMQEKYLWTPPPPPEAVTPLTVELETMVEIAKDAKYSDVIPDQSPYRELVDDIIFQRIQATDYPRLKNRLLEYARKNKLQVNLMQ